jgi:hypothetical protein
MKNKLIFMLIAAAMLFAAHLSALTDREIGENLVKAITNSTGQKGLSGLTLFCREGTLLDKSIRSGFGMYCWYCPRF